MDNTDKKLKISKALVQERNRLIIEQNNGEFWKPCPGTSDDYICCGYQIITPLTGCGMYCSYCVLQVYHERHNQVLFKNFDDLEREVHKKLKKWKGVVRFGTGEFADSLYLEKKLGLSQRIAKLLSEYPNTLVEFKTKSINVEPLKEIKQPNKVVIGFSMNTPRMIQELEVGTASLNQRLEAAKKCEEMGFWVAFHFDPMVWYPEWKNEYLEVVDKIFSTLKDPSKIAWWSMGGFRTMPALKADLRKEGRDMPLFSGEMVLGKDGKYRYFRPIRTDFYSSMMERIDSHYPKTTLYMCMENESVWKDSGMIKRIPNGLEYYLDKRAEEMLNYNVD